MKLKLINLLAVTGLLAACDGQPIKDIEEDGFSVTTANLQAVESEYLPESISEASGTSVQSMRTQSSNEDICAGVDFIECQPRLIRAYLLFGRAAVAITNKIVVSVARDLRGAPNNSSGVVHVHDQNIAVHYNKRSLLDYDFLVLKDGVPAGRVSASPQLYNIQFDLNIVDADKPDSRGGKIDIQVQFTDRKNWNSQITVTGQECNVQKPDDPTNGQIAVTRSGEIWKAQAMFYSGTAAFADPKTCETPATDDTGLVLYNDVVADRKAAKAAIYMLKRSETSTANLENFGISGLCSNYSDLCQTLATALGVSTTDLNTHLQSLGNPYCVQRGTKQVTFGNDCSSISPAVANTPFMPNVSWMSPYDFYRYDISIPTSL